MARKNGISSDMPTVVLFPLQARRTLVQDQRSQILPSTPTAQWVLVRENHILSTRMVSQRTVMRVSHLRLIARTHHSTGILRSIPRRNMDKIRLPIRRDRRVQAMEEVIPMGAMVILQLMELQESKSISSQQAFCKAFATCDKSMNITDNAKWMATREPANCSVPTTATSRWNVHTQPNRQSCSQRVPPNRHE